MRTKKGLGLTILSLVMAIAMVFSITSMVNTVKADNAPTVVMQNGASIRVKADDPALIYTATVDNYDAEKEYGMILVENALLSGVTDYIAELDEANYQKIACAPYEDKGAHKITARFDVAMDKLSVDYAGIAYVKDGDAYTYSNVTANNVRSVEYVASMAYLRGDGNEAILASFMPSTEGLTFGAQAGVPNNEAVIVEDNTHLEIVVDNLNEAIESYDGSTVLSFMSKDAYLPGSQVSFDILVPAEVSGNYWVKFGTTTSKNSVDFYGGPDVAGCVPGAWSHVTCEIPSEGEDTYYFYITANKGGWHNEDESVLYPLCIDNVEVLEPTGDKFVQDFENGYKGGDSASVVNFVANGNEAKGIEVEDVVRTVFVPGKVTLGDPAPEASAKVYIDKIKSDKGLATFVTKEAYPAGAKVTFDYLVPADVTSAWFAVLCTPTQEQTDVYSDWAWFGNLVKGSWQKLELTLENAGHLTIAGSVGDWGAKDSPVTEGYVLIDNFTVTVNGESVTDNFTRGANAGLFDVYTEGAVELGEGYIAPVVEANAELAMKYNFNVTETPSVTKKAYAGGSTVSFKYFIPSGTTTSGWWGIAWNTVAEHANNYHAAGVETHYEGHHALSEVTGAWTDVSFTLPAEGSYYLYFGSDVGNNWKVDGANSYALIDNFTVGEEVETFTGCEENPIFDVKEGAFTFGDGFVEESEGGHSLRYALNVHDVISLYTKKSYPAETTVSFKYFIPEGTTTQWWGWATAASIAGADYYAVATNGVGNTVGAWTNATFTTVSEGYIYIGFECGHWALDGQAPYILMDDFVIGTETESFDKKLDDEGCLFVADSSVCSLGENYEPFSAEASAKVILSKISSTTSTPTFITKQAFESDGTLTVTFDYYTNSDCWMILGWTTDPTVASIYAHVENNENNKGKDIPYDTKEQWTTYTATIPAGTWYFYIAGNKPDCSSDKHGCGADCYIIIDNFKVGEQATENFNKDVSDWMFSIRASHAAGVEMYVAEEEAPEEPEIPEEPEEPEVPEITFESLEAEGKLHEYLAEEGRVFFGKDVELSDSALALSVRFDISYEGERSFALVLSDSAFIYFDGAKTCLYKDGACVLELSAMTKVDIGVKANGEINLLMGDQYVCLSAVEIESVRFVSLFGEGTVTIEGLEVVIY